MSHAKRLTNASGIFFFSGFMLSKLQYLPYPVVSAVFRFLSLGIYLAAYGTWLAASYLQKEQKPLPDKWYAFAQIKKQLILSSAVGFCATVLSVAAVFIPALFPPAAWLFALGNAIWAIGEYHKLKNPSSENKNFSYTQQKAYFSYAVTSMSISTVAALAATLLFCFPAFTLPITIFSVLVCAALGILAGEYWLTAYFGKHQTAPASNSYSTITGEMELTHIPTQGPSADLSQAPYHGEVFVKPEGRLPEERLPEDRLEQVISGASEMGINYTSTL